MDVIGTDPVVYDFRIVVQRYSSGKYSAKIIKDDAVLESFSSEKSPRWVFRRGLEKLRSMT